MKSPKRKWLIFAGVGGILCIMFGGLSCSPLSQADSPTLYSDVVVSDGDITMYTFTPEQQAVIDQRGTPDGFLILFYDVLLDAGQEIPVRQESWYYYNTGYEVTFKNGQIFSQADTEPYPAAATSYSPAAFTADMSLAQVLAATGQDSFLLDPVEAELVPDSEMIYLEGLACGLVSGQLRTIESITIEE